MSASPPAICESFEDNSITTMNTSKCIIWVLAGLFLCCGMSRAAVVSSKQAASAARNWLCQTPDPMGSRIAASDVSGVETIADDTGEALFHVVRLSGGAVRLLHRQTRPSNPLSRSVPGVWMFLKSRRYARF